MFGPSAAGRTFGSASLVYSDNTNVNRSFLIPIVTIAGGDGPTVLLCAGNHGDEDEGQLILRRLIHEIDPALVQGRIIVLPAMNYPAVRANTRTSPLDGGNLNRSFPGSGTAGPTLALARFIVDAILPLVDAGMDLHSGAHSAEFANTTFVCACADDDLYARCLGIADAFEAPYMYVVDGTKSPTGFDGAAHAKDIPFISTELGGGSVEQDVLRIGYQGVLNVLSHMGLLANYQPVPSSQPTVHLNAVTGSGAILAPFDGIFEAHFDAGDAVSAGQTAGFLHSLDEIERPPVELKFSTAGIVVIKAVPTRVQQGTRICITAAEVTRDEIGMIPRV